MKKISKLFVAALMALAMFVPAQAATMSVFQGGSSNHTVPFYGNCLDIMGTRVQVIYPESVMSELIGLPINSVTFFVATDGGNPASGGKLSVRVGTTDKASYDSQDPAFVENLTHVADITMTQGESAVLINFDEPYVYTGGNFVIETEVVETTDYAECYYYGVYGDNCALTYVYGMNVVDFYPTATFDYTPAENAAIVAPTELDFGSLEPEQTAELTFSIRNSGQNAFTPIFSGISAPFSVSPAPAEIASGYFVTYTVTFAPDALGEYNQTLAIDCGAAGQFEIALHGAQAEAVATAEIVVCDGEETSKSFPVYGWYYDMGFQNQMIYPESELTDLAGKKITTVTFHPATDRIEISGGKMQLSFKNSELESFPDYDLFTDFTAVATLVPNPDDSKLVFVLDEPYTYEGGNLAIECLLLEKGNNCPQVSYVGKRMGYASSVDHFGFNQSDRDDFLPKVSFGYVAEDTPEPQVKPGDVNNDGFVTIGDVTALIDYLLGGVSSEFNEANADVNGADGITIGDVTALIDFLLSGGAAE